MDVIRLATHAARAAARLRADLALGAAVELCPFDIAERLGVVAWFVGTPSMEGMYTADPNPTLMVTAERPAGRRRYTCGHELGHHVFRHGTRLDQLATSAGVPWSPEEFLADRFAAGLLMPKLAVVSAFARRGWSVMAPSSRQIFIVAQDLGVGYATLIGHLERTLRCLSSNVAAVLRSTRLRPLRSHLAGFEVPHDLVIVDEHWGGRPVDVEVGDTVLVPVASTFTGSCAAVETRPTPHLRAVRPGIGGLLLDSGSRLISIRSSRRGFTGLARYRHLKEVADDQ